MPHPVLYLGDTALDRQASYLAAVMTHARIPFTYIPSNKELPDALLKRSWSCIILSDYPAKRLNTINRINRIIDKIDHGTGLFMIGGWESFTGSGGGYNKTKLAKALPMSMSNTDDRFNTSNPCVVVRKTNHEILKGLPLSSKLPCVAGFQRLKVKQGASEILSVKVFEADNRGFKKKAVHPLLVVGRYGKGRTAAFTSDAAPHWVGGLVDWGRKRVTAKAKGGDKIEMGGYYAKLFANIINFCRCI